MDHTIQIEIDSRTVEQANLCKDGHCCISSSDFNLCDIDYVAADGAVLFVISDQCKECAYKIPFGGGSVCGCPVRREIMAKYGI